MFYLWCGYIIFVSLCKNGDVCGYLDMCVGVVSGSGCVIVVWNGKVFVCCV